MITLRAPAKINLFLHVTGKRDDGYHLLDSLVVFADELTDIISIEVADDFFFSVDGPFAGVVGDDNLAVKAAHAMAAATGRDLKLHIHLQKNIPAGAGLGGGSADAAAVVKGLEQFWEAPLEKDTRDALLLKLGADVPVCYYGAPARFSGIGEIIESGPSLPALQMMIVWPGKHSATKDVFAKRAPEFTQTSLPIPAAFENTAALADFLKKTSNDLAKPAALLEPTIRQAVDWVSAAEGCLLARMSGSGSAVFGIFGSDTSRQAAVDAIRKAHPDWFVTPTGIST